MAATKPDNPEDKHTGWVFADKDGEAYPNAIGLGGPFLPSYPYNEPDLIFGAKNVREVYDKCGDTGAKYSVPVLYDKKLKTIVR